MNSDQGTFGAVGAASVAVPTGAFSRPRGIAIDVAPIPPSQTAPLGVQVGIVSSGS